MRRVTFATLMMLTASGLAAPAFAQSYPIVFEGNETLHRIGLDIDFGKRLPDFQNKCYYYGDGGHLLSFSDSFFSKFRRRGFTVEAVCLGLISNTKFDPETGKRLPTYVVANRELVSQRSEEPDAVSDELPLDLPDCFKNANPYSDCVFRYGRLTGKRLTAQQTAIYKRLGAALDRAARSLIERTSGGREEVFGAETGDLVAGFRKSRGRFLSRDVQVEDELNRYSSTSIWIVSDRLKRGYGYALDAGGEAGPSVSSEAINQALEGLSKSQISADDLRRILDSN